MHRIDTSNAVAVAPTPAAAGTPGHFQRGNPATGQKATYLDADWCESVQEELIAVVVAAGLTPNKANRAQLLQALQAMSVTPVPTGSMLPFAGSTAPSGYLLCDGSAISRTAYAALFTAIGTTWGAGNGSTTFNLPDLRGRSPVGAGAGSGLSARALAATGGEETHTLQVNEVPDLPVSGSAASAGSHTHDVNDPGHHHDFGVYISDASAAHAADGSGGRSNTISTDDSFTNISLSSSGAHTHTVTGTADGGGGAHNNMQPFAVVNFIIKA